MNGRIALPFLVLSDSSVAFERWLIGDTDQPLAPAQDVFENWDYDRDLEVAADFTIDLELAASELRIDPNDLSVTAVLKAGTGAGVMPRSVETLAAMKIEEDGDLSISGQLHSHRLSGRLQLDLSILLDRIPSQISALGPRWRGAKLWQHRIDILLEDGGDSRFPVELLSFNRAFAGTPHVHAPWYLDWKCGDFESDFGAAVRVYINSDMPKFAERFATGDVLTLQAVLGDVMSQMVGAALEQEECEHLLSETPSNSVGYQIRSWMDLALPGQSIRSMKSMREHAPGRFRASILAAADVGEIE